MIIIAERLNSTRPAIGPAMEERNVELLLDEARRQWEAGAHYLDVNTSMLMEGEPECMTWLVKLIQEEIPEALISVDSPNPAALEAGLQAHKGRAMLNSITGEQERIDAVLPLIAEHKPRVVALALDDSGLDQDLEKRYRISCELIELVGSQGIELDDIFIDPLVFPISAEPQAGTTPLAIMDKLKENYPGVHTTCGLSNISFGLPIRKQINQAYLLMCMARGLDGVIMDPLNKQMMANVFTAKLLLGQDPGCKEYINAFRAGRIDIHAAPAAAGA